MSTSLNEQALVVKAAPSGARKTTEIAKWVDIPDLVAAIVTVGNSSLQITVSGEVSTNNGKRMFVRALVDEKVADPSDIILVNGGFTGIHSFTFVDKNLSAGPHVVKIQWLVDEGGKASIGDRTLTLYASPETTNAGGLVVKAAPSGPDEITKHSNWVDVPDLAADIATAADSELQITVSAEASTTNSKRLFLRALVDGQSAAPSDVMFVTGKFSGSRSFTFTKENLYAGQHSVRIQWLVDAGGEALIGDRALILNASPELANRGGLTVKAAPSGPYKTTKLNQWVDIPDLATGIASAADSELQVTVSGEVGTSKGKRMFMRMLVDGQPAEPSDVMFMAGNFSGTRSFTFTKKDLRAGQHSIRMQWLVDKDGEASIGDRTLTATYQPGPVPDLSEAYFNVKPTCGVGKLLTILWNPHRPDHKAPSKQDVERLIFGPKPSVNDYFIENSAGRFSLENVGVLGWYDAKYPAELYWREGKYDPENLALDDPHRWVDVDGKYGEKGSIRYLDDDGFVGGHSHKWAEAVKLADADFNYANYNKNQDNVLSPDELTVLMVIPQNNPFGTQRPVVARNVPEEPLTVDGIRINSIVEAYIGSPPSLGLVAHELAHILLGTADMYFGYFQPYAAGPYSLMDQSPRNAGHLDPFHKLRLGWLTPKIITTSGKYTIRDVATHHEVHIMYDPLRGDEEYFIIENRWCGNSYNQHLPSEGIAIWHVVEEREAHLDLPPPPGVNPQHWGNPGFKGWGRRAIRMLRPILGPPINWNLWDGSNPQTGYDLLSTDPDPGHVTLKWADGVPSGFSIASFPSPSPDMVIDVTAPY